jgi:hypothetical protein
MRFVIEFSYLNRVFELFIQSVEVNFNQVSSQSWAIKLHHAVVTLETK